MKKYIKKYRKINENKLARLLIYGIGIISLLTIFFYSTNRFIEGNIGISNMNLTGTFKMPNISKKNIENHFNKHETHITSKMNKLGDETITSAREEVAGATTRATAGAKATTGAHHSNEVKKEEEERKKEKNKNDDSDIIIKIMGLTKLFKNIETK